MRATLKVLAACCLCIVASPQAALAEWHFTPLVGVTFKGNTTIIDPESATGESHALFGGAVSLLGSGILGAEGIFTWTPAFFQGSEGRTDVAGTPIPDNAIESSRVTTVMGNVVLTTPRRMTEYFLRPYVSGGFGLLRVAKTEQLPPGVDPVFPLRANYAGFNIGGGAVGFFSQRTGVRFDFRYVSTLRDTDDVADVAIGEKVHLRYLSASIGLVIRR